jgi:hypothetical protein
MQKKRTFPKRFHRENYVGNNKGLYPEIKRDKEDSIGESQPFRERTLSVQDKVRTGR